MPMLGNTDKYKSSLAATVFTATSAMVDLEILQLGTAVGNRIDSAFNMWHFVM